MKMGGLHKLRANYRRGYILAEKYHVFHRRTSAARDATLIPVHAKIYDGGYVQRLRENSSR